MNSKELQERYAAGERYFCAIDLVQANLSGINLSGANLSRADLSGANLSRADLSGAKLRCAKLERANLTDAKLHRANLGRGKLAGAKLSRADLRAANLKGADLAEVDWKDAELWGTVMPDGRVVSSSTQDLASYMPTGNHLQIKLLSSHQGGYHSMASGCDLKHNGHKPVSRGH